MATVSTRKPASRKPQTLEQQLTSAQARARTAKIVLILIGQGANGFQASVTSERDPHTEYTITRDQATGDLVCTCPASVVCKHIGAAILAGASYHSNAKRPEDVPVTPNPNRQPPEPEPPAPAPCGDALSSARASMPYQQRCEGCGESWHVKAEASHYICPRCVRNDRQQVEDYWREFPLLMDVTAEVARIEAQMEAEGFCWSEEARTWVRTPALVKVAR